VNPGFPVFGTGSDFDRYPDSDTQPGSVPVTETAATRLASSASQTWRIALVNIMTRPPRHIEAGRIISTGSQAKAQSQRSEETW
jgi:hypothetical protein